MEGTFGTALCLTTLAGLSTGLGGLLVLLRRPDKRMLGMSLGFAAGVMITVSLNDLLPSGEAYYRTQYPLFYAGCRIALLLLCGMLLAAGVDCILLDEGALLLRLEREKGRQTDRTTMAGDWSRAQALRCGLSVGLALLLHNLPEGIVTLFSGAENPLDGVRMSAAIALHNIPEGISVAAPLWFATGSRWKSAGAAFLSGLAEPIGAVLAWVILTPFLGEGLLHALFLLTAGVMCRVSVTELLFGGFAMGAKRETAIGFALGVCGMTIGIVLLS